MSKRLSSRQSNRVKWVPDANLCQVKLFLSEDCPSQVGRKVEDDLQAKTSWMFHCNRVDFDDQPPGFGGQGHSKPLKHSRIPQIKWKCPPRFVLNSGWQVVAGELSKERETQKFREMRVLEAVYPRESAIPPSPLAAPESEECDYDDRETPIIPIIPIEEDGILELEPPQCPVPLCLNSTSSNADVMGATSMKLNTPIESKPTVDAKSLGASTGFEADVGAAVSAAFAAIMKSNEEGSLIDIDLLIKILRDPKMIERLLKDFSPSTTTKAAPMSDLVSVPVPLDTKECHFSVFEKPYDENANMQKITQKLPHASHIRPVSLALQVPTVPLSSSKPQNIASPQLADQCSSSTSPHFASGVVTHSTSNTSLESQALLSKKLEDVNHLLQVLLSTSSTLSDIGSKMAIPTLAFPTSEADKIISKTSVGEDLELPKSSSAQFLGLNASRPSARPDLFSRPDGYLMQNPTNLALESQRSLKISMSAPKSTTPTSMLKQESSRVLSPKLEDPSISSGLHIVSSTGQANQSLHLKHHAGSSIQSSSQIPDRLPVTSISSKNSLVVKDINYCKSLIKLHGMDRQETQEKYTRQHNPIVSELTGISRQRDARTKTQRPCKYFRSATGCKKGSRCPYQHDSLLNPSLSDAGHSTKRIKYSRELPGRM